VVSKQGFQKPKPQRFSKNIIETRPTQGNFFRFALFFKSGKKPMPMTVPPFENYGLKDEPIAPHNFSLAIMVF
jgi:hypothetical protein